MPEVNIFMSKYAEDKNAKQSTGKRGVQSNAFIFPKCDAQKRGIDHIIISNGKSVYSVTPTRNLISQR